MMDLTQGKGCLALSVSRKLREHGHEVLLAGGCVRDFLMGKPPADFDIATSAPPEIVETLFARTVPVGKQFGVILVIEGDTQIEVATFRKEGGYRDGRHPDSVSFTGAREDALRRDFTVNGLFYDPFRNEVIDYVDGENDIRDRRIRAIGDPYKRFEEDKLRLLRAVRFASNLDFTIDLRTWQALCSGSGEIRCVSAERIRDELAKLFTRPHAGRGLQLLDESGLLAVILPEVSVMKGVEQPRAFHPEGDVFRHTRLMLDLLERPSPVLAFAVLLHDIGKPRTFAVRDGRITFYEHADLGAQMAEQIMRRLRFSNDETQAVCACVKNHMRFGDAKKMREGKLKQLFVRPTYAEELELHRIDCIASHGLLDNYLFLKEKASQYAAEDLRPPRMVTGHDLIALGVKPGPLMKKVLDELYERQLEKAFEDRSAALEAARKAVSEPGNSG